MTRRYVGERTPEGVQVVVTDSAKPDAPRPLNPRFDLRNHSPTGFEMGYAGSGPAQLALALCADALGNDKLAQRVYQDVKFKLVSRIEGDRFEFTDDQIKQTVARLEVERGR